MPGAVCCRKGYQANRSRLQYSPARRSSDRHPSPYSYLRCRNRVRQRRYRARPLPARSRSGWQECAASSPNRLCCRGSLRLSESVFFVKNPVRLRDAALRFNFSQYFRIVWSNTAYKIKTEAYTYEIEDENSGHELFAFHWEPNAPNSKILFPHMHLGSR